MRRSLAALLIVPLLSPTPVWSQQQPDLDYRPAVARPAWPERMGPVVVIDEGHANFHTADRGYRPFAELLRRDGFVVRGSDAALRPGGLDGVRVLVIANALGRVDEGGSRTSTAAFTEAEIERLRTWVTAGGSLLLIVDHMPFPGAARGLAAAFGFELTDGFAVPSNGEPGPLVFRSASGTLRDHPVTRGRSPEERVDSVVTFTGQAFRGTGAVPLLVLERGALNLLPRAPWVFDSATARLPAEGWWQGAVKEIGRGRVALFGEAAMFTAQRAGPELAPVGMNAPAAAQNAQLALNLVRWLTADGDSRSR